jgi:hypothetical protein
MIKINQDNMSVEVGAGTESAMSRIITAKPFKSTTYDLYFSPLFFIVLGKRLEVAYPLPDANN